MGASVVDYRISTVVVQCRDCGQDVGLYPSRHKCQQASRPPLPPLPAQFQGDHHGIARKPVPDTSYTSRPPSSASSVSSSYPSSDSSPSSGKWANRFAGQRANSALEDNEDDSIYFSKFAAHLPEQEQQQTRKLWGKVRQNDKWKQLTEKNDPNQKSGKLWGKLLQATQNMADRIPMRDDKGAESDESDWEGETHVSRVLREYYEKQRRPLPGYLRDERTPRRHSGQDQRQQAASSPPAARHPTPQDMDELQRSRTGRRRLWEKDDAADHPPASHRRQAPPQHQDDPYERHGRHDRHDRPQERSYDHHDRHDRHDRGYQERHDHHDRHDRHRDERGYARDQHPNRGYARDSHSHDRGYHDPPPQQNYRRNDHYDDYDHHPPAESRRSQGYRPRTSDHHASPPPSSSSSRRHGAMNFGQDRRDPYDDGSRYGYQ